MSTFDEVGFDHAGCDAARTGLDLLSEGIDYHGLIAEVLHRIAMRAIDHDVGWQFLLVERFFHILDTGFIVVRSFGAAAKNHVARVIAFGRNNGGHTLLGDREKMVWA